MEVNVIVVSHWNFQSLLCVFDGLVFTDDKLVIFLITSRFDIILLTFFWGSLRSYFFLMDGNTEILESGKFQRSSILMNYREQFLCASFFIVTLKLHWYISLPTWSEFRLFLFVYRNWLDNDSQGIIMKQTRAFCK